MKGPLAAGVVAAWSAWAWYWTSDVAEVRRREVFRPVLFGRGRISEMMGDFGKGVKSFRKGLNDEDNSSSEAPASARIEGPAAEAETTESAPAATGDKTAS